MEINSAHKCALAILAEMVTACDALDTVKLSDQRQWPDLYRAYLHAKMLFQITPPIENGAELRTEQLFNFAYREFPEVWMDRRVHR